MKASNPDMKSIRWVQVCITISPLFLLPYASPPFNLRTKVIVADDACLLLVPCRRQTFNSFLFFYGENFQLDHTMQCICRAALD